MKRFVTIIAAAAMMFSAGTAFAQINFGAGYVNSVDKTKVDDKTSTNTMNGFYVGEDIQFLSLPDLRLPLVFIITSLPRVMRLR